MSAQPARDRRVQPPVDGPVLDRLGDVDQAEVVVLRPPGSPGDTALAPGGFRMYDVLEEH